MRLRSLFAMIVLASAFVAACKRCSPPGDGRITVDASSVKTLSLELSVLIGADGFRVKSLGANLAPGCASPGEGVTVPMKDGAYDFAGLTACAIKLKGTPAGEGTAVTIAAAPAVKYRTVVSTMDAIRSSGGRNLFPEVSFGLALGEPATNGAPARRAGPE